MTMTFRTKEYFVKEAFASIKRNSLMSIASISTVAVSLLILGIFTLVIVNMNNIANVLESQVQITAYIKDGVEQKEMDALGEELKAMEGVTQVTFVSKEEALSRFSQRLGESKELLDGIGEENPLPNSYEVQVSTPEQVNSVVQKVNTFSIVEESTFGKEVIEHLFSLTKVIRIGGVILIVFLAIAALFIIANTIRITVFSRRKEVNIMKYVGATDWFIRWPFLLEGILLGFLGSLIAMLLLVWVYGMVVDKIHMSLPFFPLVPRYPLLVYNSLFLLFIGTGIGALGSSISLRKFLKV